jgi:hypothetical protein
MINMFAMIVNDDIVYVSKPDAEPKFEVVVFANSIAKLLGQKAWRLHKICLMPINNFFKENILTRQVYYKEFDLDVFYCMNGNFSEGSRIGYEILEMFQERIEKVYKPELFSEMIKEKKIIFQQICEEIAFFLERNYGERIKAEENLHETFVGEPALLYSGISCQGLPIVSKLYDPGLIVGKGLSDEDLKSKVSLLESTISGQLATISINSFIRAKAYVEEIQLLLDEEKHYGFINFANIGINRLYTLELFTMGQPNVSSEFFKSVRNSAENNFECIQKPFAGELKTYSDLKQFLSALKFR